METSSLKDHFDGDNAPHAHFICRKCGRVFDLNLDISKLFESVSGMGCKHQIEDCKVLLQGVCEDCEKLLSHEMAAEESINLQLGK